MELQLPSFSILAFFYLDQNCVKTGVPRISGKDWSVLEGQVSGAPNQ